VDYVVDGEGRVLLVGNILDDNLRPGCRVYRSGLRNSVDTRASLLHNIIIKSLIYRTHRELKATGLDGDIYPQLFESSEVGGVAHCAARAPYDR
jgi:hypothetical protein